MALKRKITKEEFAKLPADIQAEYTEDGDSYMLDVEGIEDTGALKRAKDRESQLRKEEKKRADEAEARLAELEGDDARKKGDIATLEKKWKGDYDKMASEKDAKISKQDAYIKKQLTENVATKLANELSSKNAKILLPHIQSRLVADLEGDEPVTRVIGADGKLGDMTIDQLKSEFVANKDFAGIITLTKASGGASDPKQQSGGGAEFNPNSKPADLARASANDLVAHINAKKAAQ